MHQSSPYSDRLDSAYGMVFGLGQDEIGYLVPTYDYQLHPHRRGLMKRMVITTKKLIA